MIDFNAIPKDLKNMLINIFLLPFWYVSIYLFLPHVYRSSEIILISSICIGLTVVSSLLSSVLASVVNTANMSAKEKADNSAFDFENVMMGFFIQTLWISVLILLSYLTKTFSKYAFTFYGFTLTYFVFLVAFFIFIKADEKDSSDK